MLKGLAFKALSILFFLISFGSLFDWVLGHGGTFRSFIIWLLIAFFTWSLSSVIQGDARTNRGIRRNARDQAEHDNTFYGEYTKNRK